MHTFNVTDITVCYNILRCWKHWPWQKTLAVNFKISITIFSKMLFSHFLKTLLINVPHAKMFWILIKGIFLHVYPFISVLYYIPKRYVFISFYKVTVVAYKIICLNLKINTISVFLS